MSAAVIFVLNHQAVEKHPNRDDILYTLTYNGDEPAHLLVWHWCPTPEREMQPQWRPASIRNHRIITHKPLTLDPSIAWSYCCGRHGHITKGEWIPATPVEVQSES